MRASPSGNSKRKVVSLAFATIAVILVVSATIAIHISGKTHQQVEQIGANALESVHLLGQVALDIERQQRLVEAHIFEATTEERLPLERAIDAVRADYLTAARQYEPLATLPGEAQGWRRIRDDVEHVQGPVDAALELSRENRDDEARAIMQRIAPSIDAMERDVAASIEINSRDAQRAQRTVKKLLISSLSYRIGLWILGLVVTIGAGAWVTRILARGENREREAYAVLQQRNHELDAFSGRVAHDLRGPLAATTAAAQLLATRSPEGDKQLGVILRGVARMQAMVEDLLQLSHVEGATRSDVCDPAPVVLDVQENLADRIAAADASMHVAVVPALVRCRAGLFRQIVANLLENALRYSRPHIRSEIQIAGHSVGGEYEFRVSDNGIGMTTEEASHAFDPLFRARRLREVPGTGLGLSIVKRIVQASGGSTSVDSKLGQGTTFVIRLPLEHVGAVRAA